MSQPTVNVEHITSYWRSKEFPNDALVPQGLPSYFDLQVSGNTFYSGLGWLDAWCINPDLELGTNNATYTNIPIYSSYELDLLPAGMFGTPLEDATAKANLDLVNWVINQDYTAGQYNYGEVQSALWKLLGYGDITSGGDLNADGPVSLADVNAIYAAAQAHDGYVPDTHEYIAVILDFGLGKQPIIIGVHPAKLGDFVWHDLNADGVQDAGESGIAGATVNLVRDLNNDGDFADANEVLATTATDAAGYYEFEGVTPGLTYQVQFTTPAGFDFLSPRQQGGNAAADSDGLISDAIVLAPGEFNRTLDSGFYQYAALGDFVWNDVDRDGIQDSGESGIDGVTVNLLDAGGNTIASTLTSDDPNTVAVEQGYYAFTHLSPGASYKVEFVQPTGFTGVSPRQQGTDAALDSDGLLSDAVTLSSGEFDRTLDSGFYQVAALGDFVWHDVDADGVQDASESGIDGATVRLLDANGNIIATTTTGDNPHTGGAQHGYYEFTNLTPGAQYKVQFVTPSGFDAVSPRQQGGDAALDSDGSTSDVVVLAPNAFDGTIDSGFYQYAALGDFVWNDVDRDGIQDSGESGIDGVTVNLLDAGGNTIASTLTGDDPNTVAVEQGYYAFTHLAPGASYKVEFVQPTGFTGLSPRQQGTDAALDSDGLLSDPVTLTSGEFNRTIDSGFYQVAALGDFVWHDLDADGVQDASESGIDGATVNLLDANGNIIATTTTGDNPHTGGAQHGYYEFTNLTPGAQYKVQFVTPSGFGAVSPRQQGGNGSLDSDGSTSDVVVLAPNAFDGTIDSGFYKLAQLGDRIWLDKNANGQQDAGETGLSGLTVKLIGGGADGLLSTTADNTLATTTTGTNGIYGFSGLTPGVEYQVEFSKPAGYSYTAANSGNDSSDSDANVVSGRSQIVTLTSGENNTTLDAGVLAPAPACLGDRVWCDADGDGKQDTNEVGIRGVTVKLIGGGADGLIATTADNTLTTTTTNSSGLYSFGGLTPGVQYQVQFGTVPGYTYTTANVGSDSSDSDADAAGKSQIVTLAPGENNKTIDAGLVRAAPACLGDRVWYDIDRDGQQDSGEAGVCGLTVKLIGGGADGLIATTGDNTLVTTTTNSTGNYRFTGLTAGVEYQVQFTKPTGFNYTLVDVGADVSDSDANTLTGKSQIVVLGSGENNTTVDAGIVCATTGSLGDRVWFDANGNGKQDSGESGLAGVKLQLTGDFNNDGVIDYTASTTTNASGNYSFSNLPAGKFTVSVDTSTLPAYLKQTFDLDGVGTAHKATATLTAGQNRLDVDFGYAGTKFFVVDSACDTTFQYATGGSNIGKFVLQSGNVTPTGATANVDGSKLWVLDQNKNVYLYKGDGSAAGTWKASDLSTKPEGIAVDGQDIWIVDSAAKKIFWYDNGALLTSGTATATKVFALNSAITNPKGIATDGTSLWLVNSDTTDKVFKFAINEDSSGNATGLTSLGSWTLSSTNATPTGLTIDPTGASNSIWVVDDGTNQVFEYANARSLTSGAGPTPTKFNLASTNGSPQDIADPRALLNSALIDDDGIAFDASSADFGALAASGDDMQIDTDFAASLIQQAGTMAQLVADQLLQWVDNGAAGGPAFDDHPGAVTLVGLQQHIAELIA